jgi:UDP-GlcNAc:undecaprenyl-phosphate GlcNAc-1-phosphate transferase
VLEPDLSYTLTILLIVVTINAVNFIDGLDGLAAGVVGIAGLAFFSYSYTLTKSINLPSQSVPAIASAVLVGMCAGFLPHNFNPARIFMGDTGSMLIGLMLAYGPISSTQSLDPSVLVNYSSGHAVNRFPTILPVLLPVAILIIPYADLLLAVIRRTARGKSPFSPDREHLHHRLQNLGHSHRQSVLLMYLWAGLFSGAVVGLSVVRTQLVWLGVVTLAALIALLLATIPQWRLWRKRPVLAVPGAAGTEVAVSGGSVAAAEAARSQPPIVPSFTPRNDPSFPAYPTADSPNGYGSNGFQEANGVAPVAGGGHGAHGDGAQDEPESSQGWTFRDYPVPPKSSRR